MLRTNGLAAVGEIPPELARALCGMCARCQRAGGSHNYAVGSQGGGPLHAGVD
jgi:hypothetical protein